MSVKVLIVEDEMLVAMDLEFIVSNAGYQVIGIAPDRPSVHAVGEAPQVALVDLNLRDGLTGPEIARDLGEGAGAAVIFVTANPNQIGDPPVGAIGYVQKPFTPEAVLAAIEWAAGQAQSRPPHGLHLFQR